MNAFLAKTVAWVNATLAQIWIVLGGLAGYGYAHQTGQSDFVVFLASAGGLLAGFIFAVVVHGFLAIFLSIRDDVAEIRKIAEQGSSSKITIN